MSEHKKFRFYLPLKGVSYVFGDEWYAFKNLLHLGMRINCLHPRESAVLTCT